MFVVSTVKAVDPTPSLNTTYCRFYPDGQAGAVVGNVTISSNCVIYGDQDGVVDGNINILPSARVTLYRTLVFSPGYSVNIQTGGIVYINTGGMMKQGEICIKDNDNDGYADTKTLDKDPYGVSLINPITQIDQQVITSGTCPNLYRLRENMNNLTVVDNDPNPNTTDVTKLSTSDREMLRLGFELNGITDVEAAVGDVQIINKNLLVCTASGCPATTFNPLTGNLYVASNVGIGTASPNAKLDVAGGNVIAEQAIYVRHIDGKNWNNNDTVGDLYLQYNNSTYNTNIGNGKFLVRGSDGNVGIGTPSPVTALDVRSGSGRITANALFFYGSGNAPGDGLPYARLTENYGMRFSSPDTRWALSTSGSFYAGYVPDGVDRGAGNIYASGNVGIGTTGPGQKLDVNGQSIFGLSTHTYLYLRDDESTSGSKSIHANSNVIGFLSGAGSWLSRWDNAGNQVNTGTVTAPTFSGALSGNATTATTLATNGAVSFTTDNSGIHAINAESTGSNVRLGAAWQRPGIYNGTSITIGSEDAIYFVTRNVERARIDSSNNLYVSSDIKCAACPNWLSTMNSWLNQSVTSGASPTFNSWTTNGRNNSNEWIQFNNYTGLYSPLNNAHFFPNNGSYGSWKIEGTRGGWAGIEFPSGAGNISLMIGQGGWGGMTTGMHANNYGWLWRFDHSRLYADYANFAGTVTAASDVRNKTNIQTLPENTLEKVLTLRGVSFNWNAEYLKKHIDIPNTGQIGVIAQEVEKIFPELVETDTDGYKSVDYTRLGPILIEAIKEQQTEIDSLKQQVTDLNQRLINIESKLK